MIINVVKLKSEGKLQSTVSFDYNADNSLISIPSTLFDGNVKVDAFVSISGNDVNCDITVSYSLIGECSRCLNKATCNVSYQFDAFYKNSHCDDDNVYFYKSGIIDLTSAVNEALIISQPTVIYCKQDCKGLCPVCGKNLNDGDCEHNI